MALDLWQIRRRKKMTIEDLATRAGIPPGLIKAYELGQRPISARDMEKLARALLVEPWDIKELSDPPPRGPSRPAEEPGRFGDEGGPSSQDFDSGPPPRYPGSAGSPRYGNEFGSGRYGSDAGPSRYGGEGGASRYGEDRGAPRFNSDSGSRYGGEPGPSRYGSDAGSSRYGGEPAPRRYNSDAGYYRYGSDAGSSGYRDRGRDQGGAGRYGGERYSRYGDEGAGPAGRPMHSAGRPPYDDARRMDRQRQPRKPRTQRRQPSSPARQSQIEHLKGLLIKLDMSGDELLRLAGKPLSMLTRKEAARLLSHCQSLLTEQKPAFPKGKRQRPYLPESVDEHELVYLTEVQLSGRDIHLTLFDGERLEGKLLGFSPYALTITRPDNQEVTVQKLAVAYYQVEGMSSSVDQSAVEEEHA